MATCEEYKNKVNQFSNRDLYFELLDYIRFDSNESSEYDSMRSIILDEIAKRLKIDNS